MIGNVLNLVLHCMNSAPSVKSFSITNGENQVYIRKPDGTNDLFNSGEKKGFEAPGIYKIHDIATSKVVVTVNYSAEGNVSVEKGNADSEVKLSVEVQVA